MAFEHPQKHAQTQLQVHQVLETRSAALADGPIAALSAQRQTYTAMSTMQSNLFLTQNYAYCMHEKATESPVCEAQ